MKYAVVIEKAGENLSAYVPDLPGCIATGNSTPEVEQLIREAISFHFIWTDYVRMEWRYPRPLVPLDMSNLLPNLNEAKTNI